MALPLSIDVDFLYLLLLFQSALFVHGLWIKEYPENKTIRIGSETTLRCNVDGRHDTEYIRWYSYTLQDYISNNWEVLNTVNTDQSQRFSILTGVSGDRSYDLRIINAQSEDSGKYECVYVENDVMVHFEPNAAASIKVLALNEPGVECDIEVKGGGDFSAGDNIHFFCTTTSHTNSHTRLKLFHDGERVWSKHATAGNNLVETSSLYVIRDETTFLCRLRIDDGTLETCQLDLLPPGNATLVTKFPTVKEGETAEYICKADGFKNNRLTYSWHFIPDYPPGMYFKSNSTFIIPNVQREYNGIVISCLVSGGGTMVNSTAILYVTNTSGKPITLIITSTLVALTSIMCICLIYVFIKRRSEGYTVYNRRNRSLSQKKLTSREYPTPRRVNIIERPTISPNDNMSPLFKKRHERHMETKNKCMTLKLNLSENDSSCELEMRDDERDTVYENVDPLEATTTNNKDLSLKGSKATLKVEMKCCSSNTDALKYAELDLPYNGKIIHDTCYKVTYSEVRL